MGASMGKTKEPTPGAADATSNDDLYLFKQHDCQAPTSLSCTQLIGDETEACFGETEAEQEGYDTAGYDTAPSECEESSYHDRFEQSQKNLSTKSSSSEQVNEIGRETQNFVLENATPESPVPDSPVPERTVPDRTATDQFVFRNKYGELKRFHSTLQWVQATAVKDRMACLDCAAQISTRDLTSASTSSPSNDGLEVHHLASANACQLCCNAKSCSSTNYTTTCNNWLGSDVVATEEQEISSSATATGEGNSAMIEAVDNLIARLEQLMINKHEACRAVDAEVTIRESILNLPLTELSPHSKKEVHSLLQEAADSMDIGEIDMDSSQSSIELVRSIIKEAGKRFGFGEDDWPKKLASDEHLVKLDDDTIVSETQISTGEKRSQTLGESATTPPIDNNQPKITQGTKSTPLFTSSIKSSRHSKKNADAGKVQSAPRIKRGSSRSPNHPLTRSIPGPITFDEAGKCRTGDSCDFSTCHQTSGRSGTIVKRQGCIPPKTEEYYTCRQILQDTKGVKASLVAHKHKCANKKMSKKPKEKKMPMVETFKTSTKKGAHSYFEILNTRMTIPTLEPKKMMTEATVPVPIYSEAVWINGELIITLKELDRELSHLPLEDKCQFTRLPKSIAIEFIREFKQDRLGQKSPNIIKRVHQEKEQHMITKSPKPFNTKVDFIFKRDPMVLGTLDKKQFNRKVLKQQKLRKSGIPTICVV